GRSNAIEPTSPGKEGDALAASASAATAAPAAAAKTRIWVLPTLGLGPPSPRENGKSTLQLDGAASRRQLDATVVRPRSLAARQRLDEATGPSRALLFRRRRRVSQGRATDTASSACARPAPALTRSSIGQALHRHSCRSSTARGRGVTHRLDIWGSVLRCRQLEVCNSWRCRARGGVTVRLSGR